VRATQWIAKREYRWGLGQISPRRVWASPIFGERHRTAPERADDDNAGKVRTEEKKGRNVLAATGIDLHCREIG